MHEKNSLPNLNYASKLYYAQFLTKLPNLETVNVLEYMP